MARIRGYTEIRVRVIGTTDDNYAKDKTKVYPALLKSHDPETILVDMSSGEFYSAGWELREQGIPDDWRDRFVWSFWTDAIEIVPPEPHMLTDIYE